MIRNRFITILAHFLLGFFRNDFDQSRFMMEEVGCWPSVLSSMGKGSSRLKAVQQEEEEDIMAGIGQRQEVDLLVT
jgi:hypothetical protein